MGTEYKWTEQQTNIFSKKNDVSLCISVFELRTSSHALHRTNTKTKRNETIPLVEANRQNRSRLRNFRFSSTLRRNDLTDFIAVANRAIKFQWICAVFHFRGFGF